MCVCVCVCWKGKGGCVFPCPLIFLVITHCVSWSAACTLYKQLPFPPAVCVEKSPLLLTQCTARVCKIALSMHTPSPKGCLVTQYIHPPLVKELSEAVKGVCFLCVTIKTAHLISTSVFTHALTCIHNVLEPAGRTALSLWCSAVKWQINMWVSHREELSHDVMWHVGHSAYFEAVAKKCL